MHNKREPKQKPHMMHACKEINGHRLSLFEFLQLDFELAISFKSSWDLMQREVMNSTRGGPLGDVAEDAGRGCDGQLQRLITRQREDCCGSVAGCAATPPPI